MCARPTRAVARPPQTTAGAGKRVCSELRAGSDGGWFREMGPERTRALGDRQATLDRERMSGFGCRWIASMTTRK